MRSGWLPRRAAVRKRSGKICKVRLTLFWGQEGLKTREMRGLRCESNDLEVCVISGSGYRRGTQIRDNYLHVLKVAHCRQRLAEQFVQKGFRVPAKKNTHEETLVHGSQLLQRAEKRLQVVGEAISVKWSVKQVDRLKSQTCCFWPWYGSEINAMAGSSSVDVGLEMDEQWYCSDVQAFARFVK